MKFSFITVLLIVLAAGATTEGVQPYQEACGVFVEKVQDCSQTNGWTDEQYKGCMACVESLHPKVDNSTDCPSFKKYLCLPEDTCEELCSPCKDAIRTKNRYCAAPTCETPCPEDTDEIMTECGNLLDATRVCLNIQLPLEQAAACFDCAQIGGPHGYPNPFTCKKAEQNLCYGPKKCGCGPVCSLFVTDLLNCINWCEPKCDKIRECFDEGKKCKKAKDCCSKKCVVSEKEKGKKKKGEKRKRSPKTCAKIEEIVE